MLPVASNGGERVNSAQIPASAFLLVVLPKLLLPELPPFPTSMKFDAPWIAMSPYLLPVIVLLRIVALATPVTRMPYSMFPTAVSPVILWFGGTVAATQARRAREVALLKTVGMTRGDVVAMFAVEYTLTGLVAAVVGMGAGALLAWAVLTRLMELPWSPSVTEILAGAGFTVVIAVVAGLVASARALTVRPVEVLRAE